VHSKEATIPVSIWLRPQAALCNPWRFLFDCFVTVPSRKKQAEGHHQQSPPEVRMQVRKKLRLGRRIEQSEDAGNRDEDSYDCEKQADKVPDGFHIFLPEINVERY
jgi:hypothetical protein